MYTLKNNGCHLKTTIRHQNAKGLDLTSTVKSSTKSTKRVAVIPLRTDFNLVHMD